MTAVIYARYSSDSQSEESIDSQLRECIGTTHFRLLQRKNIRERTTMTAPG
jgi:DNA invertase Pin-like site-specific DNA recombinase